MAELEILALDEAGLEIEAPQAGSTYVAKRDVSVEGDITVTGTVDGRDIAADGALAATAIQPNDNISTLVNDSGFEANVALASQAEAEAGVEATKTMTPVRVAQAITAQTIQHKLNGVVAPVATNDVSEGYSVASIWIDVANDKVYICVDSTTNVAVWINVALSAADFATVATTGDSDDLSEGVLQLLLTVAERAKLASLSTDLFATGITAWPTGGQPNAIQLTDGISVLTTVGSDGDSVKLPAAAANKRCVIMNQGTAHADLFPASGDKIADNAVDAAIVVGSHYSIQFIAIDDTTWIQL